MPRLSARDFKRTQRRPLDLKRLREFGLGVLLGLALAVAALAWLGGGHTRAAEPADTPRPDPHRAAPPDGAAGAAPQKYDFYEMLPNFEVVVPEKDKEVRRDLPPGATIERPGIYVLQVGSYRSEPQAERVRSQLALQGVTAKVQRVAVDADVWHRVRIGPITDLAQLDKVRRLLRAADVDALVIRVGD